MQARVRKLRAQIGTKLRKATPQTPLYLKSRDLILNSNLNSNESDIAQNISFDQEERVSGSFRHRHSILGTLKGVYTNFQLSGSILKKCFSSRCNLRDIGSRGAS